MQLTRNTYIKAEKSISKMILIFNILAQSFLYSQKLSAQSVSTRNNGDIYQDFKTELIWEAKVKIGDMIPVGESKHGVKRVIPITGGTFIGPKIKGEILSGGEDSQLVRPDGDTELNARYLLKTDDRYVIQVVNKALIHTDSRTKAIYCKSVLDLEAPKDSPYDYLNHAIFIGTLKIPELKLGEEPYVVIGVYKLL
nr:DUF3237 domain-containing protein [uncultured Bacteroides sp.]